MIKRQKLIFLIFIVFVISMSTVSASGLFKYSGSTPSLDEIKNYIVRNYDSEYTTYDEEKNFEEVATLTIKNTYIDMEVLKDSNKTLSDYFDRVHSNENLDGYLMTCVTEVPLYHLSDDSEFVVGIINTDEQSEVFDVVFAENNDKGIVLDNEYYDYDTGLAYVSIFDLYREENENLYTDCVQAQLLRAYSYGNESEVDINISNNKDSKSISVSEDISLPEIEIPLDETDVKVENVYINGNGEPLETNDYKLKDNNLVLNTSAANLRCVDVELVEEKSQLAASLFFEPVTAYALTSDADSITDIFGIYKETAHVGDYVDFKATGTNTSDAFGIDYVQTVSSSAIDHTNLYNYMVNHYGSSANSYVLGKNKTGKYKNIYRSTYSAHYGIKMDTQYIKSYNSEYLKKWLSEITEEVQMGCIEVSNASYQDMTENNYLDYTAMVTAVGNDYVAITFCSIQKTSEGTSNKVICGTYAIAYGLEKNRTSATVFYKLKDGYWPTNNHLIRQTVLISTRVEAQYLSIDDEPKREGYAFVGWTSDKSYTGSTAQYDIGDLVKASGSSENVTLYAVWKEAHDMEYVYTDYDDAGTYLYEDPENFEETSIKIPEHHYFVFDGYFTEDDTRVTDNQGNLVQDNIEGICENGVFKNVEDVKLYAHFVDP